MSTQEIRIQNARVEDSPQIQKILAALYALDPHDGEFEMMSADTLAKHIRRFSQGQFVARCGQQVVGFALTMLTAYSPYSQTRCWLDAIGGFEIRHHDPHGEWLYGVDCAIEPSHRGKGIGTALYDARFAFIERANLRGFFAGGMLMGYQRYSDTMTISEYAEKVIRREIYDPTVTMQMNRGFTTHGLIENYTPDLPPLNHAVHIIWENPRYSEARSRATA